MLGRQQIAGLPTAISEIFKNAYDAYAQRVRADFLRDLGSLIIRDDGQGMTNEQFVDRWLTLGTESKLEGNRPPAPIGRAMRTPLGEKGIGRLAMAAVGPNVLVVTRSNTGPTTAAFVSWRLFELPGINLDEIPVAMIQLDAPAPGPSQLLSLINETAQFAESIAERIPDARGMATEIRSFPLGVLDRVQHLGPPQYSAGESGTLFLVSPTDQTLEADLVDTEGEPSHLVKMLIGFTNPLEATPDFQVTFWDRGVDGTAEELIGPAGFWSDDDLKSADHEIDGTFDQLGSFAGTVRIYGEVVDHSWTQRGRVSRTKCGPFRIRFGVMQGAQRESPLPPDRWALLIRKAERIGGLYIYRNGVRILPYGNNDYDFLDIERNRSKGASYYFFSYRRMFGYVSLNTVDNRALTEKAGREGFQENAAFREFQSILKAFLVGSPLISFDREGNRLTTTSNVVRS